MKDFLSQFKSWAHWFAGAVLSAAALYATPGIHEAVNAALAPHKKLLGFVVSLSGILVAYSNSKKAQ